jgi:hypothetical protein
VRPREACQELVDLILGRARDHEDELVAAEPCQQIARSQGCGPDPGELDEEAIAGSVAAAVVDELEAVVERRALSRVRITTATLTIVEMMTQTDALADARADSRLNPSAVIMSTA